MNEVCMNKQYNGFYLQALKTALFENTIKITATKPEMFSHLSSLMFVPF